MKENLLIFAEYSTHKQKKVNQFFNELGKYSQLVENLLIMDYVSDLFLDDVHNHNDFKYYFKDKKVKNIISKYKKYISKFFSNDYFKQKDIVKSFNQDLFSFFEEFESNDDFILDDEQIKIAYILTSQLKSYYFVEFNDEEKFSFFDSDIDAYYYDLFVNKFFNKVLEINDKINEFYDNVFYNFEEVYDERSEKRESSFNLFLDEILLELENSNIIIIPPINKLEENNIESKNFFEYYYIDDYYINEKLLYYDEGRNITTHNYSFFMKKSKACIGFLSPINFIGKLFNKELGKFEEVDLTEFVNKIYKKKIRKN